MNLADPELEYVDPTPNVHSLFIHFDNVFFWTKLAGKAVVRWSKRMYSSAGTCGYEGRGGICDIALSEPLLKLRPRKDLVETLLHEMIHAYLFLVGKDQSRDGHGPNFLSHMHRINHAAGLNISVYHDFHDEVKLYQNHVWRCNGPCQKIKPYFGIVRRTSNRVPGPSDCWWGRHKRACGGTFIKCQEPAIPVKPVKQTKPKQKVSKSNGDITKYINNNNETIKNKNTSTQPNKNNETRDSLNTSSVKKTVAIPKPVIKSPVFTGSGPLGGIIKANSISVRDTVRNVWANKTIPTAANVSLTSPKGSPSQINNKKRISDASPTFTPPKKIKKIDDYFKTTATSILKDVYGKDFEITQSGDGNKLKVTAKEKLVDCPICNSKVSDILINAHIDECLNKDVIEILSEDTVEIKSPNTNQPDSDKINIKKETIPFIPVFKPNQNIKVESEKVENKPSTSKHWVDLTMTDVPIKSETMISKGYADLTSGYLQIKSEPSTTKVDLTAANVHIKSDPRTSKVDLTAANVQIKSEPGTSIKPKTSDVGINLMASNGQIKSEPSTSNVTENKTCPCCDKIMDKPVREHLDECLIFFDNDTTIPNEGASTSFSDRTIVIDDSDDEFDETQTMNATGTKTPCPCCMKMVETADMNDHLDICLGL